MSTPNSSLSQFIEEYPLYSKFGTDQPIEAADLDNLVFNFYCSVEKEVQPFRLEAPVRNGTVKHHASGGADDFTEMFSGICKSCLRDRISIIISGASQNDKPRYFIRKIGQYPAPEAVHVKLPEEISQFFSGENLDLYQKALRNLDLEYGIGAFAYFRKIIPATVERLIEALSDPYWGNGSKVAEAFSNYEEQRQKTKFIEEVSRYLPKSLQEHGATGLLMLHDVESINMEELSEEESLKKCRDIDTFFRYLLRKIHLERNEGLADKEPGKYFLRYS